MDGSNQVRQLANSHPAVERSFIQLKPGSKQNDMMDKWEMKKLIKDWYKQTEKSASLNACKWKIC